MPQPFGRLSRWRVLAFQPLPTILRLAPTAWPVLLRFQPLLMLQPFGRFSRWRVLALQPLPTILRLAPTAWPLLGQFLTSPMPKPSPPPLRSYLLPPLHAPTAVP